MNFGEKVWKSYQDKINLVLVLLHFVSWGCQQTNQIYVSPKGHDHQAGTRSQPIKTLAKAQTLVRDRLQNGHTGEIQIILDEGTYPLKSPWTFNLDDSGNEHSMISYQAKEGSKPVISGGISLRGWTRDSASGFWKITPTLSGNEKFNFRELFINQRRAIRARHPNTGFLHMVKAGEDRRTNFFFQPEDFPRPAKIQSVELIFLHDWSITRIGLDSLDLENHRIFAIDSIGARSLSFFNLDNWEEHPRYFLENDLNFLDQAYEWYYDEEEHLLYLDLPDEIQPDSLDITIPFCDRLLTITGDESRPVRNIEFKGLQFQYCRWNLPGRRYAGIQACHFDQISSENGWSVVGSAVELKWAEQIIFDQCRFVNMGGSALHLGTATKRCEVKSCAFDDISGNAVMIGEGQDRIVGEEVWWKVVPHQVATGNKVNHCRISNAGQQFFGAVGIWCGLTAETELDGNEIFDLPYTGISVGWMWNPEKTPCRDNRITHNHIHHIMKVLSDGGGIYMLGRQPGSRISDNRIHNVDLNAGKAESNGMFIDEGSTELVIEGNIIYDIAKSPLRFHRAEENIVRYNVLSTRADLPPIRFNNTPVEHIKLTGNQVLTDTIEADQLILQEKIQAWEMKKELLDESF